MVNFFCGNLFLPISLGKDRLSLKIRHQLFTTFFTLKFAITKEIGSIVLTLEALLRSFFSFQGPSRTCQAFRRRGKAP